MTIGSISRFVLRHKALVGAFWLIVTIAWVVSLPWVFDILSQSFDMPGSDSADMATEPAAIYGNDGAFAPLVVTVTLPEGQTVESPGFRDEWLALEATVTGAEPSARVVSWATTGDATFVSDDGRTTFGLVYLATDGFLLRGLEPVRAALSSPPSPRRRSLKAYAFAGRNRRCSRVAGRIRGYSPGRTNP